MKTALLHVLATLLAAQLVFPAAFHSLASSWPRTLAALFMVALPALTYSLLVALWILRIVANASRGRFH